MANNGIFHPGQRLKLMALESVKSKVQLTLVGYRKSKYLIAERPATGNIPLGMTDGTRWMANFVRDGDIYTFQTQVIGISSRPIPMIFLNYPKSIDRTSLRQSNRIPVQLPTLIKVDEMFGHEDDTIHKGLIRDISEGGCQLLTTTPFPDDTILHLTVVVDDQHRLENVVAEVKSHQDLGERHLLGLSFSPARTTEPYQKLVDFLQNLRSTPIRY